MSADDALFWAKVDRSGECWEWTGAKNPDGYGILRRWTDGAGKNFLAHRYSLMLAGADLAGMSVDHICFNPSCVRPEHLRVVTNKQNHEHLAGANVNSKSGHRGVFWDPSRKKWKACVKHNYREISKRFTDLDDAIEWARLKRIELFTHNDIDRAA